jgi:hypothetical protein
MKDEIGSTCSMYGRDEKYIKVMFQKSEGKRSHGRSRHRWEGYVVLEWILGM